MTELLLRKVTNLKNIFIKNKEKMQKIDEIIEEMAIKLSSLNYDFLTEKELDRTDKFLSDLSDKNKNMDGNQMYVNHPDWVVKNCSGLINGLRSYLDSLKIKIAKRENIPNWYIQNKLT